MRSIIYMAPVESMSGKWAQRAKTTTKNDRSMYPNSYTNERFVISQMRTREYASGSGPRNNYFAFRSESNAHPLSSREQTARTLFTYYASAVRAIYADDAQLRTAKAQWRASGQAVTLRKFIWDSIPAPQP